MSSVTASDADPAIDYTTLALRICAHSADISAALAERARIDHRFTDRIDLRSVWPPRAQHESLTAAEQTECWAEMDRLDAELDTMCRYSSSGNSDANNPASVTALAAAISDMNIAGSSANLNKPTSSGSRAARATAAISRQNSLRRQNSVQSSSLVVVNQSVDESAAGGDPQRDDSALDEPLVTLEEIQAFNATAPSPDDDAEIECDLQAMCDRDKQSVRPLFKLVPKLREFTAQIQAAVAGDKTSEGAKTSADTAAMPHRKLNAVLDRLHELMVDINYLDEHPNIYDVNAVRAFSNAGGDDDNNGGGEDPVQQCLEELFKQIMNQQ